LGRGEEWQTLNKSNKFNVTSGSTQLEVYVPKSALAQAKNDFELKMHSRCLDFFSFKFWVGEGFFPLFATCSFQVSNEFSLGSQYVPNSTLI
jgi:hypothetical protein